MRRVRGLIRRWVVVVVIGACSATAFAQGPGGMPGMPMQRQGPARGQPTGAGMPGAPMARMGRSSRSGGGVSTAAPARRNYSNMTGVGGVMSSQNFRASNLAGQARGAGIQRSSAGVINNATRGMVTLPSSSR